MKKMIILTLLMIFSLGLASCKKETDEQKVAKARKNLTITFTEPKDNVNSVTNDIFLRITQDGVAVSWTSSDLEIVDERGFVTTPLNDTIVSLTATLTLNEVSETKTFTVYVKKLQENTQEDNPKYLLPSEFENLFADKHIYITTVGQGGELSSLNTILSRYVYSALEEDLYAEKVTMGNMIKANDVPVGSVVILVPGASGKGLGAAGTNLAQEQVRAQNFAAKAAAGDIILVVVHMGGEARRGGESDPLINACVDDAALVLVEEQGNTDGFFNNLSNPNVYVYPKAKDMANSFKQLFGKYEDLPLPGIFTNLVTDKNVYITTIGQGGELSSLNTILSRYVYTAQEEDLYEQKVTMGNMIKANDVPVGSVVIIVPGASGKGLGAAGTNLAQELVRAQNFAAKAASGDIVLIVVHMGGEARRGGESDPLINALVGEAAIVLVEQAGDMDDYFTNLAHAHVYIYDKAKDMADSFKQIFNKLD